MIVFIDSGCIPRSDWLRSPSCARSSTRGSWSLAVLRQHRGERIYSGDHWWGHTTERYVPAAPTINLAFRREVFDAVGGFDESFAAGEDIDFTWRLCDARVPAAMGPRRRRRARMGRRSSSAEAVLRLRCRLGTPVPQAPATTQGRSSRVPGGRRLPALPARPAFDASSTVPIRSCCSCRSGGRATSPRRCSCFSIISHLGAGVLTEAVGLSR